MSPSMVALELSLTAPVKLDTKGFYKFFVLVWPPILSEAYFFSVKDFIESKASLSAIETCVF